MKETERTTEDNFFTKYKLIIEIISSVIFMIILGWFLKDLIDKSLKVGVDLELGAYAFWIATLIFSISMLYKGRASDIIKNILVYLLASISVFVAMSFKFENHSLTKQIDTNKKIIDMHEEIILKHAESIKSIKDAVKSDK